jgi:hypothetical protein
MFRPDVTLGLVRLSFKAAHTTGTPGSGQSKQFTGKPPALHKSQAAFLFEKVRSEEIVLSPPDRLW